MGLCDLTRDVPVGELLKPAAACHTAEQAQAFLQDLIEYYMVRGKHQRKKAEEIARANIGWYAYRVMGDAAGQRIIELFEQVELSGKVAGKFDFMNWMAKK